MKLLPGIAGAGALLRDNAMFYKDVTQWLRNRTFTSLFFGLLIMAEVLCLLVIGTSKDMAEPGSTLFYGLYLMLVIYAILIAYQGNSLTGREFANRTFELFELSGMSLERMVAGKLLSMLYQFFFGFFCLVPFMFFAYMLGGLDFVEMIVGVILAVLMAVPLYLVSLAAALTARTKQVTMLVKLGSMAFVAFVTITMLISIFGGRSFMGDMFSGITRVIKRVMDGSGPDLLGLVTVLVVYVQVCLLFFYLSCDNISRENDSRETAVKVLTTTLIASWLGSFATFEMFFAPAMGTTSGDNLALVAVPVFLAILGLGLRAFYSSPDVPLIVQKRHERSSVLAKVFYPAFKPGIEGGCRTVILLSVLSTALFFTAFGAGPYTSLIMQAPWFLVFPYVLVARLKDLRYNYPGQRTVAVTAWVVLGAMLILVAAWTRVDFYGSSSSPGLVLAGSLLSPLSSLAVAGSRNAMTDEMGTVARAISGVAGIVLMVYHTRAVMRGSGDGAAVVASAEA
jgi:hypothetical protein